MLIFIEQLWNLVHDIIFYVLNDNKLNKISNKYALILVLCFNIAIPISDTYL